MLTNPLGLLALLGIPAVLAIHFLQRKAVELPVSTLFLLERTQRETASGRRFDRLIPSIPLWMQLLAVLLLTWFLTEPRFPKSGTVQRLAIVLDSSASMTVFKKDAVKAINEALPAIKGSAGNLEITVLESVPTRPRIFSGTWEDPKQLERALEDWKPSDGMTDPTASIRLGRSLVSSEGAVIYVTDTPQPSLPFAAKQIAVGRAIENIGFTGVTFAEKEGALVWTAMVRNYGKSSGSRTWSLVSSAGATEPQSFTIEPGALTSIQAAFPKEAENVRLVLSPDEFAEDDVLPMVSPSPKPLLLFTGTSDAFAKLNERLLHSLEYASPVNDAATADLSLVSYDPLDPMLPPGNAIVFVEDPTSVGSYLKGGIIAETHPLLDGLNWQSLLIRETIELERLPSDHVLLWQEKRPLIFLRRTTATPERPAAWQLCFNFDLRLSNAVQQPAFIVLLHRFAETIRSAKIAPVSLNLETNQPIDLTTKPGVPVSINATDPTGQHQSPISNPQSAPSFPAFLTIRQGDLLLLNAAVHFADTREADFSACDSSGKTDLTSRATQERNTRPDPYWQLWLFLLLAALLASWKFTKGRQSTGLPAAVSP